MQTAEAEHSLGVSTGCTARWGSCFSGSDVNSEPRLCVARCGGWCELDRGPSIRTSDAGTLARTTGVSGDCGSAVSFLMDMESTVATPASDETGLGGARSAGATSARPVAARDTFLRSGKSTTRAPPPLEAGTHAD